MNQWKSNLNQPEKITSHPLPQEKETANTSLPHQQKEDYHGIRYIFDSKLILQPRPLPFHCQEQLGQQ